MAGTGPELQSWQEALHSALLQLSESGLDLLHVFSAADANRRLPQEDRLQLLERSDALGIFVGNSKKLWEPFLSNAALTISDPLDRYVERQIEAAIAALPARTWVGYGHVTSPQALPMQRLAQAAGFLELGPAHLSVHSKVGPWCALRAVIVCDAPAPENLLSPRCARLCAGCPAPCVARFEQAARRSDRAISADERSAAWLAVRDACPLGKAFRYENDQLRYHYDRDLRALRTISSA